jgi:hypothetical protein
MFPRQPGKHVLGQIRQASGGTRQAADKPMTDRKCRRLRLTIFKVAVTPAQRRAGRAHLGAGYSVMYLIDPSLRRKLMPCVWASVTTSPPDAVPCACQVGAVTGSLIQLTDPS